MRDLVVVGLLVSSCACGGSSPSSPTPPAQQPPPTPPAWTISGTVRETRTGAPGPGAVLDFSQLETVTADSEGRWTLRRTATPASPILTDIKADG